MASLIDYKARSGNTLRRIEFQFAPDGKRHYIRLGTVTAKAAQSFKHYVERIVADIQMNRPHDPEVANWLASLDEKLLSRMRAAGLAEGVGTTQTTLGEFLDRVFDKLTVKESTRTFYGHTKRNLLDYFKPNKPLRRIGTEDAEAWRQWLAAEQGLSQATVARRVIAARTFWRKAVRWKLATENPFAEIKGGTQENEDHSRFIPADMIHQIIDHCPDAQWRLIIALARFGGIRVPSELLPLRWGDVNWEQNTIRITSPKTAHHQGKGSRIIPLFAELRQPLRDCFDQAEAGDEFVITRYRQTTQNLGTQFARIIKRAGFKTWPRLFQNLRASRESELAREYDLTTVCRWIGNSPAVAAKHYMMSVNLDADHRRATLDSSSEKAQQSTAVPSCQRLSAIASKFARGPKTLAK